jgi:hypothetical protein
MPIIGAWRFVPVYYMHLHNDVDVRDDDGNEFPDLDAAVNYAEHQTRFTLAETIKDEGRVNLDHRLDVEDESGRVLATVRFRDVITIEGGL